MLLSDLNHNLTACCEAVGGYREVLQYVNIVRLDAQRPASKNDHNGLAISADGFVMSVLPVILTDEDVPGPVHQTAFKRPKHIRSMTMELQSEYVQYCDRWLVPRMAHTTNTELKFPDWQMLVKSLTPADVQYPAVCVDAKVLRRACTALGTDAIIMRSYGLTKPVLIRPLDKSRAGSENDFNPVAPFALVMPMHNSWTERSLTPLRPVREPETPQPPTKQKGVKRKAA